ncbi:unnamed protein product, partial [marine sediment metagenome]
KMNFCHIELLLCPYEIRVTYRKRQSKEKQYEAW